MSTIKIYTCHHKPSAFIHSSLVTPLHVGKSNSNNDIGCQGDDTGDNISFKNPFYCELTAHYWVWKNEKLSDYIGFMHYRRHLNFSDNQSYQEDMWGVVNYPVLDSDYEKKFGLIDQQIESCIRGYDILLPKKWSVKSAGNANNLQHYEKGDYLHLKDYLTAIDVVKELYPSYDKAIREFNNAHDGYYTNMFIMRRDIFLEYSEWLFSVLSQLEPRLSMNNYNNQEKRVIGHIAERLFNIYIINYQYTNSLAVKELQRTFIVNDCFNGKLKPLAPKAIPIIISFDDNYALSGGALINSIIKNADQSKYYDIVILEQRVSDKNKIRLKKIADIYKNISIRFFDVNSFSEISMVHTRAHFSASTYARLFIPKLFRDYEKVIFIDSDTIVRSDLAELMNIELGDNLVAAVKDIVMEGFVQFGTMSESDDGIMPAKDYLQRVLGMQDTEKYFQAGIIVFNINKMKSEDTFSTLMATMKEKKYWFLDQDIMNKVFYNRVKYLPLEWNVYHGNGNTDEFFPNLKFSTYMMFLAARKNPKMIHYAGENKPWSLTKVDFFDEFYENIVNTPWHQEFDGRLLSLSFGMNDKSNSTGQKILLQTKIKNHLMPYINKYAPVGSPRRNFLIKHYYKIRRKFLG